MEDKEHKRWFFCVVGVVFLFLGFVLSGCQSSSTTPIPTQNRGNVGSSREATSHIPKKTEISPQKGENNDKSEFLNKAQLFTRQGKRDEALREIEAAHNRFPEDPEITRLYSNMLFDDGKSEEAKKVIEERLAKAPDSLKYRYYMQLGEFYMLSRDKQKARENLEKALEWESKAEKDLKGVEKAKIEGAKIELYAMYGAVLLKQKNYEQSEKVLLKAFDMCQQAKKSGDIPDINDYMSAVCFQLARVNMEKGNLSKAKEYVDKVNEFTPGSMDSYIIRAEYFRKKGDFMKARDIMLELAEKKPETRDESYIRIASIYCGMKNRDEAVKYLKMSLKETGNVRKIKFLMRENPYFEFLEGDTEVRELLKN